jgi:hypothetical protein
MFVVVQARFNLIIAIKLILSSHTGKGTIKVWNKPVAEDSNLPFLSFGWIEVLKGATSFQMGND